MNDDLRTIGHGGPAGRGSKAANPSAAARSLAGGAKKTAPKKTAPKKPKAKPTPQPHVWVVSDEELNAAAAAAEEAARKAQESQEAADETLSGGLPLDEVLGALIGGAQRLLGEDWEARLDTLLSGIRTRMTGDYDIDEFGLDREVHDLLHHVIEPIAEKWFRLEVRGVENIPTDGGALLVGNHSGTVPVDGLITGYAVAKHTGRPMRALGADLVFQLPLVGLLARKMGATLACTEDAERLLTSGELAAVWPEGFKGVGKPFSERYKLQRFGRGGFVSSALRAQVPIIPVSIVGAEEIYPLVGNVPTVARLLGLPYLPITPFFPLLGPLGLVPLPSKWIIEFGEPIRTDAYAPDAADDPMLLFNVTDQVRETIQQTLYSLLVERGRAFF